MTASRAVRTGRGRNAGRGGGAVRGSEMWDGRAGRVTSVGAPVASCAVTGRTGMRSTVPHGQHSSGCGHWSRRPQPRQRTVTQSSFQVRCVIGTTGAPRSTLGLVGAPHGHG